MTDHRSRPSDRLLPAAECYSHQENAAFDRFLTARTASAEAAFLLPHLRPGMRVLDCGCGPGSITAGLAEAVAPGETVGIDFEARQIEAAQTFAASRGLANLRFERADIYALPFADRSFDAVFANNVLFHLRDPLAALREARRVLRPGGVVGIRDAEPASKVLAPLTPLLARWEHLTVRLLEHNGARPRYARDQRRLLLEAGFARSEAQASARGGGTPAATRTHAQFMLASIEGPTGVATALAQGWVTQDEIDQMRAEVLAWGERPDAFFALPIYSAVGWVDA